MYPAHNAKSFTCIISFNPWNNIACMGRINPHFKDKDTGVLQTLKKKKNLLKADKIESRHKRSSASEDCYAWPLPQALQCLDKSLEKPVAQKCTWDNYMLSVELEQQIFRYNSILNLYAVHSFLHNRCDMVNLSISFLSCSGVA